MRVNDANQDIRDAMAKANVKYWEVAGAVGVADTTFTKWLRYELPSDKKKAILKVIKEVAK